jgi:hypothetical protein
MERPRLVVASISLLVFAAIVLSCSSIPQHQLQSITLSPASANAESYPNGQVQFVATGHYNIAPQTVTPLTATWGACDSQFSATTAVSVTQNGLAQCASGAEGTYTVWANDPAPLSSMGIYNCPAQDACGGGCTIQGNAQLTCP